MPLRGAGAAQVDSNKDGVVDLRELTTALSKWLALIAYPGSRDLMHPFATARDIALDFFIATKQDPRRSVPMLSSGLLSLRHQCAACRTGSCVLSPVNLCWVPCCQLGYCGAYL